MHGWFWFLIGTWKVAIEWWISFVGANVSSLLQIIMAFTSKNAFDISVWNMNYKSTEDVIFRSWLDE